MVTMVDEIFDREYAASRKELNAAISNAFDSFRRTVSNAFEVLVKIEYDEPWTAKSKRVRFN
jgi:hypothetical protein